MTIEIYTDGGCVPNPGSGGWAAILRWRGHEKELSGFERNTTNNRMEMTAAIIALEAIKGINQPIEVYTDSQYLRNGISAWCANWERQGWRTKGKKPVQNVDLWQRLLAVVRKHNVRFNWIRGHAGHPLNERADRLATAAMRQRELQT